MDENQLAQLYQQFLGRAPDPSGIATWSGQDPSTVIAGILGSQEYQSRSGGGGEPTPIAIGDRNITFPVEQSDAQSKVDQLYKSILGRSAKDDPGSQGWVALLEAGDSLENIASAIGSSQEAQNKALSGVSEEIKRNDPNNFAGKITELYASALGRTPEPKALEEYVNILNRNPDEFGWVSTHVTSSPEAQNYAQKTGTDLNLVKNNAVANYGLWTPAASSPTPGGFGGFMMKYGPYLPFAAAAAAAAPALLAAEGAAAAGTAAGTTAAGTAAGGAAGGTAATGLSSLYSSMPLWAQAAAKGAAIGGATGGGVAGLTGGNVGQGILRGALIGGATGGITQGLSGLSSGTDPSLLGAEAFSGYTETGLPTIAGEGFVFPGDEVVTAAEAAQRAAQFPNLYPGGVLPPEGYSTIYTPAGDAAYAPTADLEAYAAAAPGFFDTASKILSSPLGQLGVRGGLGLLGSSLGGGSKQQAMPQMAGGGGTYAPRGQVDYTPILNLLAPKQISRNSLLG
jgi:hypothetical protein